MKRLAAVSLFAAAVTVGACAGTEAPTGPNALTRPMIGQGAGLGMGQSQCPKPTPRPSRSVQLQALPLEPLPVSTVGVVEVNVKFTNATCEVLEMYWVRPTGVQVLYETLQPGWSNEQLTWIGHVWLIKRVDGTPYAVFRIEDHPSGVQEVYLGCTKGRNAICK